jgi:hypothetical protein
MYTVARTEFNHRLRSPDSCANGRSQLLNRMLGQAVSHEWQQLRNTSNIASRFIVNKNQTQQVNRVLQIITLHRWKTDPCKCLYLDATICEVLQLACVVVTGFEYFAEKDVFVAGRHIPKGEGGCYCIFFNLNGETDVLKVGNTDSHSLTKVKQSLALADCGRKSKNFGFCICMVLLKIAFQAPSSRTTSTL